MLAALTPIWNLIFVLNLLVPGDRVVLIGDSEGYLLSYEFKKLALESNVPFQSVTVPGSSVVSWARRDAPEWGRVGAMHPDMLLVSLGANDACVGAGLVAKEAPYLKTFLRKARATGASKILWLGPPSIGPKHPRAEEGLQAFAELVSSSGVIYLDARNISVEMWSDQLHCSRPQYYGDPARGCRDWARWVWSGMVETIDIPQKRYPRICEKLRFCPI